MISTSTDRTAALPPDLAEGLERARATVGAVAWRVSYRPTTGSTNDDAARLADAGAPEWTIVVADHQSAGRGRLGRSWVSPPGAGLYVSVVFRPPAQPLHEARPAVQPSLLTLVAGVALAEAVRNTTGLPVAIKWPNDLMHDGRKIAGILAEASAQGGSLEYVILGFGINVRSAPWPPDVAARAAAIETELGRPVDRGQLFARCLLNLAHVREALAQGAIGPILDRWRRLSPSAVGSKVAWRSPTGLRRGWTAGLGDDGALLVDIGGRLERVVAGEVAWE